MSLTLNGSAGVTTNSGAVYDGLQTGTAVASTSGTSIDFTGIPSWVKRITVMFNGVSTNAVSNIIIQIGSGSVTTSGYASIAGNRASETSSTVGFIVSISQAAADLASGQIIISNISGNTWVSAGNLSRSANAPMFSAGNSPALSGALDRLRITTTAGTDTFDAGTINIIYE